MAENRKVLVTCGPIPARVDSVKYLTNMFRGGLAFKTASWLAKDPDLTVTVLCWEYTRLPEDMADWNALIRVKDVFEYYDYITTHAKDFDAFVLAAAVANLTPVHPYERKFPSHMYRPGEEFDIRFMIAPRAIDAVKQVNPHCCLIGYKLFDAETDEQLIDIARHTLKDSHANVIFANHPATAKNRKIAVMPDGSTIPCTFDEHLELMKRAICQEYYRTKVTPLSNKEAENRHVREAMAIVKIFEKTFSKYGTIAVPVRDMDGAFVTTSRGHRKDPVLVRSIEKTARIIHASGKATLNAPALQAMLGHKQNTIVIHRHQDDPAYLFDESTFVPPSPELYVFPGTEEERYATATAHMAGKDRIDFPYHGYLMHRSIQMMGTKEWMQYDELFPEKYRSTQKQFQQILNRFEGKETLELGGNRNATGKYSYDPYVSARCARNVDWGFVQANHFDLAFAKNSLNYLTMKEIRQVIAVSDGFIANTFLIPPEEKISENEAAVRTENGFIQHFLRLADDTILRHQFHAYTETDYRKMGLYVYPYGKNSALVTSVQLDDLLG